MEHYSLEQVINTFGSLKQEKGIDKILNSVKETIFGNDLNETNIENFKKFVRQFTSLYYLMKDKFSHIERDGGERYFEHLREVVNNVLELDNPNINKILIAIAHDSREDTNKTFESLKEDYGYHIAIAVESISKQDWERYIDLSITDEKERNKQAKETRNTKYFEHLESFQTMFENVKNIALEKGINIDKKELEDITKNALDVKFADRIHNMTTQWDPDNLEKVERKLEETKKYFLKIAENTNPRAFDKLKSLVLTLEIQLSNTRGKVKNII